MLGMKKQATKLEDNTVSIAQCPLCESITVHLYYMEDAKTKSKSKWYACACGLIWQVPYPEFVYDKTYLVPDGKKFEKASKYLIKVVNPIIEESMYGRRCLMVGHNKPMAEEMAARGWITHCIDKNVDIPSTSRHIQGDFETFEFPADLKYNLLWMYQTLECMRNPFETLKKAKDLLAEDGIIYIATPDTDFLYTRSPSGFHHWNKSHNHIMWSQRALESYLEKLGFNIILSRKNHEVRFPAQDDFWCVAQKKFF